MEYVACMGENRNADRVWRGKLKERYYLKHLGVGASKYWNEYRVGGCRMDSSGSE